MWVVMDVCKCRMHGMCVYYVWMPACVLYEGRVSVCVRMM